MEEPAQTALVDGVVLDIGPGVGALVIYTREHLAGAEIEVRGSRLNERRVHAIVHRRRAGSRFVFAAVFQALDEGDYELWWGSREDPVDRAIISGGQVTEVDWQKRV